MGCFCLKYEDLGLVVLGQIVPNNPTQKSRFGVEEIVWFVSQILFGFSFKKNIYL